MRTDFVIAALLIAAVSAAAPAPSVPAQAQQPIRVFVQTDNTGDAEELSARQTSVKDLSEALASHKKFFVTVDDEEKAEIQIRVLGRGLRVPKMVLGLGPRPGESTIGTAPTKNAELSIHVTVTSRDLKADFKNKNKANDNPRGWKSAADDLADQLEQWVLEHYRSAIGKGVLAR